MLLRRARHLSLLPLLGAVGAAGSVGCSHGPNGTGAGAGDPALGTTSQTASDIVLTSTSSQAPATPFSVNAGALRSDNVVRTVAIAGDSVVGRWGGRTGPDTRTARLAVGSAAVTLPAQWTIQGSDVVRSAGGVTERIAPTSVGYRRSWTYTAAPAQGGSILASIGVSADSVVSMDASGLHVERSGTRFRIGSATWIDAGGQRTAIAPSYDRGELVYEVPAGIVAQSAFPAVLDPDVGPEFLVPPTENVNPWIFTNDPSLTQSSIFALDNGGVGVVLQASGTPYWGSGYLLDLYTPASSASGLTLQTSKPFAGPPPLPTGGTGTGGCSGYGCPPPPVPASAPCGSGSDECLAWAYLSSAGAVYVQRFDTTSWQWYDANPVLMTSGLNDAPKTGSTPTIITNGSQYLVCWLDTGYNDVHCTTRQTSSLNAIGSTVDVAQGTTVSFYASAATTGAFAVLVPGVGSADGGGTAGLASVTTIDGTTGAANTAVSIPASLGRSPTLVGESGGNFLVAGSGSQGMMPALYTQPSFGGPGKEAGTTIVDSSVTSYTSGLIQRVTAAGALSGAPFSAGASFSAEVLELYCNGGPGASLADAGLLPVPGRGTLGRSGIVSGVLSYYNPGGSGNAAFCDQFSVGTYNQGITYNILPPFVQAMNGPLADGGYVKADPDGGLCKLLDAGPLGSAALLGVCYDTVGGGLGAFVAPVYNDASTTYGSGGSFSGFSTYEVTPGATVASPHLEIAATLPLAISGIQNGFVSAATSASTAGYCPGCQGTTTSLTSTLYDAGSGTYVNTGASIPLLALGDRRTALHGSYDSTSQTYFVGWFGEGTTPLAEAGSNSLPDSAIYVGVYADPGGAAEAGTTPKVTPVGITAPPKFSFASALSSGCSGCGNQTGSLDTEPLWSMDAALQTALVTFVGQNTSNSKVLIGQLVNSNGSLKGTYGALTNVPGVSALHTCHTLTQYFVSYLTTGGTTNAWSTVSIDPTQSTITPVPESAGSPVPFANSIGSVMPAYLTVTSGSNTSLHVGLVSASSPTTMVKDFDSDISNWSPPQAGLGNAGSGGGYYGNLDVYTGTDNVIVTYPVQSGSSYTTYCARINTTTGAYIDSHPCTPPANTSSSCYAGGYCSFGGAGAPGVGDAAEKLLAINTSANPPTVQRWFVEPWGYGETPDLPFPTPTRPFASSFIMSDGGAPVFSWDTSAQATVIGGNANALALYFGIWTQSDGFVERDLYARWIRPGFVGNQTCASNDECDTNQCTSGQCVPATTPPPPDAGSASSSGGSTSGGSSSGSGGLDATASSSGGSNGGGSSGAGSSSGSGTSSSGGSSSSSGATSDSGTGSSSGSAGGGDSGTGSSSGGASSSGAGTSSGGTSSGATGGDASATNDSGTPGSSGSVGSSSGSSGASGDDGGLGAFDGGPTVMSKGASGSKGGCGCVTVGTEGTGSHRGDAGAIFGMAVAAALVRRRRR